MWRPGFLVTLLRLPNNQAIYCSVFVYTWNQRRKWVSVCGGHGKLSKSLWQRARVRGSASTTSGAKFTFGYTYSNISRTYFRFHCCKCDATSSGCLPVWIWPHGLRVSNLFEPAFYLFNARNRSLPSTPRRFFVCLFFVFFCVFFFLSFFFLSFFLFSFLLISKTLKNKQFFF